MEDFWQTLMANPVQTVPSAIDTHLQGRSFGESFESVRLLTDKIRKDSALSLPAQAGTRVSFTGSLGALMTYTDAPSQGAHGTVVTVRSGSHGDVTDYQGKVFVKWDDGKLRSIYSEHLRAAGREKSSSYEVTKDPTTPIGRIPPGVTCIRVASLGDLTSFLKLSTHTLIHKSTQDLWKFSKDAEGNIVVERLFDDNGDPLRSLP